MDRRMHGRRMPSLPVLTAMLWAAACPLGCGHRQAASDDLTVDGGQVDTIQVDGGSCIPGNLCVATVAGSGKWGYADGVPSVAMFQGPNGIDVASDGRIVVTEPWAHRIRTIEKGAVKTLVGFKGKGYAEGPTSIAKFYGPLDVSLAAGTIYVADSSNNAVRAISTTGTVLVAGSRQVGYQDGPAAQAKFWSPMGLAVRSNGDVLVGGGWNHAIRVVSAGMVSTLAGKADNYPDHVDGAAASARFILPKGIDVTPDGVVYVADSGSECIRRIASGWVSTIAGKPRVPGFHDGPAGQALFSHPADVAVGPQSEVYVADAHNNRIREIRGSNVTTIGGDGVAGYRDGPAQAARFNEPTGLAVGAGGKIYVADSGNNAIRVIFGE